MRVVVVGAGIGGLTLAQALRRRAYEVLVVDRDADVSATRGYRLHLHERACQVLRQQLPPALFQAVQASSAGPRAFRQFAVTDHRLRLLAAEQQDGAADRLLIGRVQLRRLLAYGLGDGLRFGTAFDRFEADGGGVVAHLADGTSVEADLLVGADGVGSRVATGLAQGPTSALLGITGIAGRTPVTAATRPLLPHLLTVGPALALGPGGVGMFLSHHDPSAGAVVDPAVGTEIAPDVEGPTLVWGLIAADGRYPDRVRDLGGPDLVAVTDAVLDRWLPDVRELVRASEPATCGSFAFSAADPRRPLTPWPVGRVTALGDAVHAMPPTGGQAAATAVLDAGALTARLESVRDGSSTLAGALHGFHADMAGYAPQAVAESLVPVRWIKALSSPAATYLARAAFPVAAGLARVARITRGGPG